MRHRKGEKTRNKRMEAHLAQRDVRYKISAETVKMRHVSEKCVNPDVGGGGFTSVLGAYSGFTI
jgi:hypothetical protein